jgi:hypothetical protein
MLDLHSRNSTLPAALYGVADSKELVRVLAPPRQQALTILFMCTLLQHQATEHDTRQCRGLPLACAFWGAPWRGCSARPRRCTSGRGLPRAVHRRWWREFGPGPGLSFCSGGAVWQQSAGGRSRREEMGARGAAHRHRPQGCEVVSAGSRGDGS